MKNLRRNLLKSAAGIFSYSCACSAFSWPKDVFKDEDEEINHTQSKKRSDSLVNIGCALQGFNGFGENGIKTSNTTGFYPLDAGINVEYNYLCNHFQVRPGFLMFEDNGAGNAFATTQKIGNHRLPDGTVLFGLTLMREEFANAGKNWGRGDHAMMAIMAHEWAHIYQFKQQVKPIPGKAMELQADALAGWFMGIRAQELQQYMQVDLSTAMSTFFKKGDYEINSPQHHGTPKERLVHFSHGIGMAMEKMSLPKAFAESSKLTRVETRK